MLVVSAIEALLLIREDDDVVIRLADSYAMPKEPAAPHSLQYVGGRFAQAARRSGQRLDHERRFHAIDLLGDVQFAKRGSC